MCESLLAVLVAERLLIHRFPFLSIEQHRQDKANAQKDSQAANQPTQDPAQQPANQTSQNTTQQPAPQTTQQPARRAIIDGEFYELYWVN
jgi:hypothetical protein